MSGSCPPAALSDVRPAPAQRWSNTKSRNHPRCGSSTATHSRECPHGLVGEIWVHGANVADGYWRKPPEEQRCFGATLVDPSPGTPDGPWLRTGDLGFIYEGELFIVGRIKDLLIIRGSNHYPEDIEATVQEITGGRVAAISVPVNSTETARHRHRAQEAGRARRGFQASDHALAHLRQKRRHLRDLQCARLDMSGTSFWCRPGQFPPPRAARSGAPPVPSSTARTNSPGWTPEPAGTGGSRIHRPG